MMLVIFVALAFANAVLGDELAANQLVEFLKEHPVPEGIMMTSWGKQLTYGEVNSGLSRDDSLIMNHHLFESMSSLARERLAPRAVHAKGSGAFGYFEVTHDVSKITNVNMFNKIGKKTPLFMRFSPTAGEKGSPELHNRNKGIAIKFYTKEGIMDIFGFNVNGFPVKDPVHVRSFVHSVKANPKTGFLDTGMVWDFIVHHPEALLSSIQSIGLGGQPRSYATIPGHAIHPYQVETDGGAINYIKMHWSPDEGIKNFTDAELASLINSPDYHTEDLYNRIAQGNYPTYTLHFQVIPHSDIKKAPFDIFDMTLYWPEEQYPYHPVGKIVLNKNPENYQNTVEMAAFNPANLPPGIQGVDKIFEARTLIYRDGHLNRMGSGFNKVPVNCPLNTGPTYNRDGVPPVGDNGGDSPNYYPNSFNGPVPLNKTITPRYRPNTSSKVNNFWQVVHYINKLSKFDREVLFSNVGKSLAGTIPLIRQEMMQLWNDVDVSIAGEIQAVIDAILASSASG